MSYKIIASDMDGTLLNTQGVVSPENLAAIHEMTERGILFVPASGRGLSEMPEQIKACDEIRYVMYSNGAAVLDRKTGEKLLCCMPRELSVEVLDVLADYDVHITQRQGGECYVDAREQGPEKYEYFHVRKSHAFITWNYGIHKEDFAAFSRTLDDVELYVVHFHDPVQRRECLQRFLAAGNVEVAEANPNSLEISAIGASKGSALLRLAEHLGIAREETIGMGDSDNDTAMIKAAGLGLAMENACDELKQAADQVICHCDDHAMRYVLDHFCG